MIFFLKKTATSSVCEDIGKRIHLEKQEKGRNLRIAIKILNVNAFDPITLYLSIYRDTCRCAQIPVQGSSLQNYL